ncbi:MAG TPA: aldolase/citrate lyase family protein [Bacteroidales bacterium]|nr:aldolase/citrate lyase family protein [Bacteroidales bacterium]
MESSIAKAGNSGPKIRSDCEIILELKESGGIVIDLTSRVESLYGESIRDLATEILSFYGINNASVRIIDSGALPFVIAARTEAAVKQLLPSDLEYLPDFYERNRYPVIRDRVRFARLYLPGNNPSLMINAGLHGAEGIILDLEDSVAPDRKDEARILVRNALRQVDFYGAERMVRINQGELGQKDLKAILPHNVNLILIPKCENAGQVNNIDLEIQAISRSLNLPEKVYLMPIIENAVGVENAYEIATSSKNIVAMAIGLEDYTADLGVQRTREGKESFYARTRIISAAKAAGLQPIDSVFSDVSDMEGLKANVSESRSLGFEGMGCIHPRQIKVIRQGYAPDENEIEKSKKVVLAFNEAREKGLGVVALGSKMIDPPVVARAQRTIDLALSLGMLKPGWEKNTTLPEE